MEKISETVREKMPQLLKFKFSSGTACAMHLLANRQTSSTIRISERRVEPVAHLLVVHSYDARLLIKFQHSNEIER